MNLAGRTPSHTTHSVGHGVATRLSSGSSKWHHISGEPETQWLSRGRQESQKPAVCAITSYTLSISYRRSLTPLAFQRRGRLTASNRNPWTACPLFLRLTIPRRDQCASVSTLRFSPTALFTTRAGLRALNIRSLGGKTWRPASGKTTIGSFTT